MTGSEKRKGWIAEKFGFNGMFYYTLVQNLIPTVEAPA